MTKNEIKKAADEVCNWIESACSEIGYESGDMTGAEADALYDDVDCLCDLSGDRIHDECRGNWLDMIKVAKEIKKGAHTAMIKAMNRHIKRWTEYSKDR